VKSLDGLTDQQLAIMGVVWTRGEATAHEIHQALEATAGLARGTIGTMLHRLERQGILTHRSEGREFWYRATVRRDEVMAARLNGLVGGLFGGDLSAMVSFAVSKSETRKGDLQKLRKLLDDHTRTREKR
jgi:BlaI family transcriptional regulator, penicillinase repressor